VGVEAAMARAGAQDRRAPLAEDVQTNISVRTASAYSASNAGVMVFQSGTGVDQREERLFWLTRAGTVTPIGHAPARFMSVELSPDGERALATIVAEGAGADVWILNLERGQRTRVTFDGKATGAV